MDTAGICVSSPFLFSQLKFIQGYLLLQFDLAANIDYAAEAVKFAKVSNNLADIKAERIRKARSDFQV